MSKTEYEKAKTEVQKEYASLRLSEVKGKLMRKLRFWIK
jgi:hypothetical protein